MLDREHKGGSSKRICQTEYRMSKKRYLYLFLIFYTCTLLLFCTGSSPFINNMMPDSSVFFTIGRGMAAGRVPYLDLFDHKGLYLFFINYIGALISSTTTIGVFIIECIFISIDAVLFYGIAEMHFREWRKSLLTALIMLMLVLNYFTYQWGNLIETYAVTFQLTSMALFIKYVHSGTPKHNPFYMLIHGIGVSIVLGMRANMVLMWGAIAIVLIIWLLLNREYINALYNIIAGILGIIIGMFPVIAYGIITGSLKAMYEATIGFNMAYIGGKNFFEHLILTLSGQIGIAMLFGGFLSEVIVLKSSISACAKATYSLAWILGIVTISMSGRAEGHYYEYLMPLMLPLGLCVSRKVVDICERLSNRKPMVAIMVMGCFLLSLCTNLGTPIKMFYKPTYYYNRAISDIVDEYNDLHLEDATVIVSGNNARYYNEFGVIPKEKYFYIPAISYNEYPYAIDSQVSSIMSGENDVVILVYYNENSYLQSIVYDFGGNDDDKNKAILSYL